MRPLLLALCVIFACSSSLRAEDPATTPIKTLAITPARQTTPALKYSLMPDLAERINGNAATLYVTFTDEKPENPLKDESLKNQIADWRDMDDAKLPRDQVKQFIAEHFQSQLDLLDKAARHTTCDWQYPLEQGLSMKLPAFGQYRGLANILSLRIRIAGLEGRYNDAIHDLQTGFALAQHIAVGQTLINGLVAIAIESIMLNEIERLVQCPDTPNLYWVLAALPQPLVDLKIAENWERRSIVFSSPYLRRLQEETFDPNEDAKISEQKLTAILYDFSQGISPGTSASKQPTDVFIQNMHTRIETARSQAISALLATGLPRSKVDAIPVAQVVAWHWLQQYRRLSDDRAKWASLPYWQAHEGLRSWERDFQSQRANSASFLILMIIPSTHQYLIAAKP